MNGSNIHSYDSPRPLVFGRCQAAYSTFLGLVIYKSQENELMAGYFGLYLTYRTQNLQYSEPIIINSQEYAILIKKSDFNELVQKILNFLINHNAFLISPVSYSVKTINPKLSSEFALNDRPNYSQIEETKSEKNHRAKLINVTPKSEMEALENQYQSLLNEIFEPV